MAGFKETKFNDRMDTAAKARAEMLAKAKIRAEAAKVNFESKTEERKAIVVARDERAARRTEEKRLAAIETEKRRKEEEERRKQAEIEAKAQAEREHEERVAAMEALETEQKAKRDARYAARKAGKPYPGAALAYAWSDDEGARFSDTEVALDNTCECCRLGVAFAGPGRPAVIFRNIFPGSVRDHAVVTFRDPATPGPLTRVSTDNWKIDACPHHGPSLAIAPDGSQHAAWFTDGSARKGLFYARAESDGAAFGPPRPLGTPDRQPARPYLLSAGPALHLVWKEFDGDKVAVRWPVSTASGRSWSPATTVADTGDASDHPLLVARDDRVYLSWLTKNEGYRLIALGGAS